MKLIPRFKPYYNHRELITAISPSRGNITRFEKAFAEKFECNYALMFPYGRSGLYSLLKVWELENVEIICPAYTCVVVTHAVVLSGNIPVFVDCQEDSFNMGCGGIREAITDKTRAIVVTHLFGYPMDMHKIDKIVKEAEQRYGHKIYIIQDAAHSFGGTWCGEKVARFGDAAIFGLDISKVISSISGGMVTTNSQETYQKLKAYREENFIYQGARRDFRKLLYLISVYIAFNKYIYGFVHWLERNGFLNMFVRYYDDCKIYFPKYWNHYPSEIEARVGLVQLQKYDAIIQRKVAKAKEYIKDFENWDDISILPFVEGATYSHFVALVNNREEWIEKYHKKGTQLGRLIEYAIPYMSAYAKYKRGEYPRSRYYSEHTINFPNWAGIK